MPRRQVGGITAVALLAVVLIAALVGVWRADSASVPAVAATAVPPDQGTAHAALVGDAGFSVVVTRLARDARIPSAPDPGAGRRYVAMRLQFRNRSSEQQRADPRDFHLVDALGTPRAPTVLPAPAADCAQWRLTDLYPDGPGSAPPRDAQAEQAGRTFGPVELCFAAGGAPSGPLTLVWDPDVSFFLFGTPTRIALQ